MMMVTTNTTTMTMDDVDHHDNEYCDEDDNGFYDCEVDIKAMTCLGMKYFE